MCVCALNYAVFCVDSFERDTQPKDATIWRRWVLLSEFDVLRGPIGDYWSLGCTYVYM